MREILFKAKKVDNGEWVEGLLTIMCGQYHIINPNNENTAYPVDTETVSQYTGIADKNGNKIWENDIIARRVFEDGIKGVVTWTDIGFTGFRLKIQFPGGASFYSIGRGQYDDDESNQCNDEVVGNIFDNPELLSCVN